MPKFNVHVFAVVRVKVCDIEADNHKDAIEKAGEAADWYATFNDIKVRGEAIHGVNIAQTEFAEEFAYYLVDDHGDTEYRNSRWYDNRSNDLDKDLTVTIR